MQRLGESLKAIYIHCKTDIKSGGIQDLQFSLSICYCPSHPPQLPLVLLPLCVQLAFVLGRWSHCHFATQCISIQSHPHCDSTSIVL